MKDIIALFNFFEEYPVILTKVPKVLFEKACEILVSNPKIEFLFSVLVIASLFGKILETLEHRQITIRRNGTPEYYTIRGRKATLAKMFICFSRYSALFFMIGEYTGEYPINALPLFALNIAIEFCGKDIAEYFKAYIGIKSRKYHYQIVKLARERKFDMRSKGEITKTESFSATNVDEINHLTNVVSSK